MRDADDMYDPYDAPAAPKQPQEREREKRRRRSWLMGLSAAMLISGLALLYLNVVGLAAQARLQLQQLAIQQTELQQKNQELQEQQGVLKSPAYVEKAAKKLGMVPEDPRQVHTIVIP